MVLESFRAAPDMGRHQRRWKSGEWREVDLMAGDAIHARGTRLRSDAIAAQRTLERKVESINPSAFEADGLNVLAIRERDDDRQQFLGVFFGHVFIG